MLKTPFSLVSLSFLLIFSPYTPTPVSALPTEVKLAAQTLQQGEEISLNGRKLAVAWSQWQQGESVRIGISDTAAMRVLGLELLSSQEPGIQPIHWFSSNANQPLILSTKFTNPYRYLDITNLLQQAGSQLQVVGKTLNISFPAAQINDIRQGNQAWGKRIVIDVDRPTFWQVSQAKEEAVVTLEGQATPALLAQFSAAGRTQSPRDRDEDDLGSRSTAAEAKLLRLEKTTTTTKLHLNLPAGYGLRISSLSNSNRIVIDIRPDAMVEREIAWAEGLIWRQQFVSLNNRAKFPVNLLEVDLRSPNITLKPMTSNPNSLIGISPLVTTARNQRAIAAINGGFFNRNNQFPLGAIRQSNRWLSSPILNRGAIAWNDQGEIKIARLSLQESLINSQGKRLPIVSLNSGYLQAGIARYTKEWGATYKTLTDNEIIILVKNNSVMQQIRAGKMGKDSFSLPSDGYLLVLRSNSSASTAFAVGTPITLESRTAPADFVNYPYILGAGPLLLENRRFVLNAAAEKFNQAFQEQRASRSAIATNSQGKLIIVAIHNRVGGRGASLEEFAQVMQRLGAVDALNLDGGSSTSLYLGGQLIDRFPVTAARVHNGIGIFFSP